MAVASRAGERRAAIQVGLDELGEERALQEAEADAVAQIAIETMEHDARLEQEDILRGHPTHRYESLEAWKTALQQAGFYYEDLEAYRQVLRHPGSYFGWDYGPPPWYLFCEEGDSL